jgi:threonine dehydrogenase-like Zn-dependent dehydrogenase
MEGERVVVEPILWCRPRGFQTYCRFCAQGEINRCERISEGDIAPGLSIGFCRDTGGSWSQYFLAHKSQLYRVPGAVSDENGLLVEPFAVGVHAVLNSYPHEDENVLIIGAGAIGLCTLAALRALGSGCKITVLARHQYQADAALKQGADQIISSRDESDTYSQVAEITGAKIMEPILGKRVIWGGFDRVYECVGSSQSLDDTLRFTRAGGNVIFVGVPGIAKNVDWSSIFIKELDLRAAYVYNHAENHQGKKRKTFDIALELMEKGVIDLNWMITQRFSLGEYKHAFEIQDHKAEHEVFRSVFEFEE